MKNHLNKISFFLIKIKKFQESELLDNAKKLYSKGEGRKACVGSCALAVVVTKEKLYVAQLGDSKAKIYKKIDNRIISQKISKIALI